MPSSEQWMRTKHRFIAAAFSFVAGYTDAISYTRWRVYTTMMTGNLILVGRSTVNTGSDLAEAAWYYALVILTFWCGVAAWKLAEHRYPDRGASALGIPLAISMVTMELVLLCTPWVASDSMVYSLTALAYAPMFGVMNATCTAGRLATVTTVATGHLVTVVNSMVKAFILRQELSQAERNKCVMGAAIIGSTLAGVMVGIAVYLLRGALTHGALMPVGPALAVLFWMHDHLAKPSSLVKKAQALKRKAAAQRRLPTAFCCEASEGSEDSEDHFDEESLGSGDSSDDGTPSSADALGGQMASEAGGAAAMALPMLLTTAPLSAQLQRKPQEAQYQACGPEGLP